MPRKRKTGKTFDIRLQITVEEGSIEQMVLEYLSDGQASPFGKAQRIMMAAKPFWQALALKYKNFPPERVRQALVEGEYLWQLHHLHMCEQVGMTIGSSQFDLASDRLKNGGSWSEKQRDELTLKVIKSDDIDDAETVATRSEKASQIKSELLASELTTVVENKPFNPFGNGIIFRS